MQRDLSELEARLWDVADELRANSGLESSEYGTPVLGLIFLRFAGAKFKGSPAVPVGRVRRLRRLTHRFPADTVLDGGVFLPDERSSASGQEKCLLSGRLRTRNLDRVPAKRSRAVQGGPPGPSTASRAAAPLDGPEKRSYAAPFEHPPETLSLIHI